MKYDASQIRLINLPELEQLSNKKCCRNYSYIFIKKLPEQKELDIIARSLDQTFKLSKESYLIPEDLEICAFIIIERLQDYEAKVSVLTDEPEEVCVYIFGIYPLPRQLEEIFGTVQSIQGQPREIWIRDV